MGERTGSRGRQNGKSCEREREVEGDRTVSRARENGTYVCMYVCMYVDRGRH